MNQKQRFINSSNNYIIQAEQADKIIQRQWKILQEEKNFSKIDIRILPGLDEIKITGSSEEIKSFLKHLEERAKE